MGRRLRENYHRLTAAPAALIALLVPAISIAAGVPAAASKRPPANPPIVFTQLGKLQTLAVGSEPRSRIVRRSPDGQIQVLTGDFFAARDPDVSFDGRRVLFSGKRRSQDRWQIYEMKADGSGPRRITKEDMDCRQPRYQSYFFVITSDRPWPQITFTGHPAGGVSNLYSTKMDGSQLRQLTFNPYGDSDPYLMPDGRLLFSSRQFHRIEPGPASRAPIFGVNVDGTDLAIYSGDEGAPWKRMPAVTGSGLAVFVENDQPQDDGGGWLAAVTVRRNLHSYRRLSKPADGVFLSPSPLEGGWILVSRRPADGAGTYGLYRFDTSAGQATPLYDDPDWQDIQACPLVPRPVPDGRSSVVNETDPTGIFYCLDVYTTDFRRRDWMAPGTASRLRVTEGIPRAGASHDGTPHPPAKRILGEIPIEKDGSFNIRVPANIPIQLQLLDQRGLALRTCSWIWTKNKEPRGCIGCHEDGERTPENRLARALLHPSVALTLPPERRRRITFETSVKPILKAKCSSDACHGSKVPLQVTDLAALRAHIGRTARSSPLVWHLLGENTLRPWDKLVSTGPDAGHMPPKGAGALSDDEIRTILEWIDTGAE